MYMIMVVAGVRRAFLTADEGERTPNDDLATTAASRFPITTPTPRACTQQCTLGGGGHTGRDFIKISNVIFLAIGINNFVFLPSSPSKKEIRNQLMT